MKKVLFFLQYDEMGSSSKYRILIYKKDFDAAYDTKYCPFWSNKYVSKYCKAKKRYIIQIMFSYIINVSKRLFQLYIIAPRYDIIVLQRCIVPGLPFTFLKHLKKKGSRIVFDIDDALHLQRLYMSSQIANDADVVMAGNRQLYDYYKKYNNNVYLIPTIDDNRLYENYKTNTFQNKCIGWIGSFSSIQNFDVILNPLNKIIEKYPEVYVKIISDEIMDYQKLIKNCNFVKWDAKTYLKEMQEFSIGIMPLKENEFNKGKCGFKLVQYLDLGKPVIATDLGENKYIVNEYGYCCIDENDWYNALENILFDEEIYNEITNNIHLQFLDEYGYEKVFDKIAALIVGEY